MSADQKPGWLCIIKMGLSALLSLAGFAGFIVVMAKGVLVPGSPAGHSASYAAGWSLFFFLLLGIPCLVAFILGALPWIFLARKRRAKGPGGAGGSRSSG